MKSLVVYDSKYGNTKLIAEEIARVLGEAGEVTVMRATEADNMIFTGEDILAVGGPTIGHGLSPEIKRLLDTLAQLPQATSAGRPLALAFDTRINWPKLLSGSAADKIATQLEELGCQMLSKPGSFIVTGGEGPLGEGERARAAQWAWDAIGRLAPAGPVLATT